MGRCPHCQTRDESWATRCPGCGAFAWRPIAGGADNNGGEEEQLPHTLSTTLCTLCAPTSRNFFSSSGTASSSLVSALTQ